MPKTPRKADTGRTPKRRASKPAKRAAAKPARKRAPSKKRPDWKPKWLTAFRKTGMVTAACKESGVGRRTVYDARADEEFAAAWDEIEAETSDEMEREAYRRAVEGVTEPVVSAGKHVTDVQKFSDTLLIFMLKGRRPERFRENVKVEHAGTVGHKQALDLSKLSDKELATMEQLTAKCA